MRAGALLAMVVAIAAVAIVTRCTGVSEEDEVSMLSDPAWADPLNEVPAVEPRPDVPMTWPGGSEETELRAAGEAPGKAKAEAAKAKAEAAAQAKAKADAKKSAGDATSGAAANQAASQAISKAVAGNGGGKKSAPNNPTGKKAIKQANAEAGSILLARKRGEKALKRAAGSAGGKIAQRLGVKSKMFDKVYDKAAKSTMKFDPRKVTKAGQMVTKLPGQKVDKKTMKRTDKLARKDWRKVHKDLVHREVEAHALVSNATKALELEKMNLKRIEAQNEVIRSSWVDVDTSAKDPLACSPVPACLAKKKECKDTYDTASCIKARRGNVNLCEKSETIQNKCCATCKMDSFALCQKERLILAGFGADAKPDVDKKVNVTGLTQMHALSG